MKSSEYSNSVPVNYVLPLMEDLSDLGSDLSLIWEQAALRAPLTDLVNGSLQSIPASEFTRLYRCCMEELERQSCARAQRRPMGRPAINLLCYAVISCHTLREVISRVALANLALEERGGEISLEELDGQAIFTMHVPRSHWDNSALLTDVTGLYFYHQLFSWLISRRLPMTDVRVAHEPPGKHYPMLDVFDCPVAFSAPTNQLIFPAQFLSEPTVRTVGELDNIVDYFPFDLSVSTPSKREWSAQLRLLMLDAIQHQHEVPALETAAQLFHVSPATLRRRLGASGTSYSDIRAACQREVAEQLLLNPELSIDVVAERLGFGSDRAFRRAFHMWTGSSPSQYRAQSARQ